MFLIKENILTGMLKYALMTRNDMIDKASLNLRFQNTLLPKQGTERPFLRASVIQKFTWRWSLEQFV